MSAPAPPPPATATAPAEESPKEEPDLPPLFLRAKRKNQTIFLECDPYDCLEAFKERLARVVGRNPDDIRLFPCLTEERRRRLVEEKQQAAAAAAMLSARPPRTAAPKAKKEAKKAGTTTRLGSTASKLTSTTTTKSKPLGSTTTAASKLGATSTAKKASGASGRTSAAAAAAPQQPPAAAAVPQPEPEPLVTIPGLEDEKLSLSSLSTAVAMEDPAFLTPILPFDETKRASEVGLENDSVLFFGFRIDGDEWEGPEADGYPNGMAP